MLPEFYIPQPEQDRAHYAEVHRESGCPGGSNLNMIEIMRGRRQEREEQRQERLADREKDRRDRREKRRGEGETVSLGEDLRITLPHDFVRSPSDPESFRGIVRFHHKTTPDAVIGHEKCVYKPAEQVDECLRALLKEPPHRLSGREIDEIASAIPNALYGHDGNFSVVSLATQNINGKQVLVMETSYNREDRRTYGVFTNPDRNNETIDAIWFEAPNRQYKQHSVDATRALHSLKSNDSRPKTPFLGTSPGPIVRPFIPR